MTAEATPSGSTKPDDGRPTVVITGAAGLIGSAVARDLLPAYRVLALDIRPPEVGQADWIRCDLTEDESVRQAFETIGEKVSGPIASVIHLAAYYDFSGEPSPLYEDLTVKGTARLCEALEGSDVEQLVFSSTLLVMKPSEDGEPLKEESPLQAEWDYPESKLRTEKLIRERRGKVPVVILRIAGVYDEDCHSPPISQQIRRIHQKTLESYFFPGDAERGQAFVHLEDVVSAVREVVSRRGHLDPEEVFLIAEPDVMSYEELQEEIGERIHGKEWPTIRLPKAVAKAGAWARKGLSGDSEERFIQPWMVDLADAAYPVSIDRARAKLGWEPSHRLRTTLPAMIQRLQRDPESWYRENGIEPPDDLDED